MSDLPYTPARGGIRLHVRATPKASKNTLDGLYKDADGASWLKVKVTAPPEDGKANKAVIRLLAKTLNLPASSITLLSGETSRQKTLLLDCEETDMARLLPPGGD